MLSGAGRSAADDRVSTRKGGSVELVQADRENEADRRKKGRKTLKKIGEGKFPLAYLCQILRLIDNRMDLGVVLFNGVTWRSCRSSERCVGSGVGAVIQALFDCWSGSRARGKSQKENRIES